jgi:hypothetical protein
VLVDDVQFVKLPNGVVLPTLVWFQRVDTLHPLLGKSLYPSFSSRYVFLGRTRHRKPVASRPSTDWTKGHDTKEQHIKGGACVVQNVADEPGNVCVEGNLELHALNVLAGLRINIENDIIGIAFDEHVNPLGEIFETLIGPFELDPRVALPRIVTHG